MEKNFSVKSKVDVHVLNCMIGRRMKRPESKVDVHILNCMSGTRMKRPKTTSIKPEYQLLIKELTINNEPLTNNAQANKVILKDFQMSEQKILVYSILPDTPVIYMRKDGEPMLVV